MNVLTNQIGPVVKGSPILKYVSLHNACYHSQQYATIVKLYHLIKAFEDDSTQG